MALLVVEYAGHTQAALVELRAWEHQAVLHKREAVLPGLRDVDQGRQTCSVDP